MPGSVQHHFDHAIDMPVGRRQRADLNTESPRDGRTYGIGIEFLAFDLACFEHVLG